jgi:hypothetical protein
MEKIKTINARISSTPPNVEKGGSMMVDEIIINTARIIMVLV